MAVQSVTLSLSTAQKTHQLGKLLGQMLPAQSLILLRGSLGTGKTTLVGGIGEGLGIEEPIISPTFTLINEYQEGRIPLYHLDLYRLDPSQVEVISPEIYWEGVEVTPGLTAIEWSERLPYRPGTYLEIQLTYTPEGTRQSKVDLVGEMDFNLSILHDRF